MSSLASLLHLSVCLSYYTKQTLHPKTYEVLRTYSIRQRHKRPTNVGHKKAVLAMRVASAPLPYWSNRQEMAPGVAMATKRSSARAFLQTQKKEKNA